MNITQNINSMILAILLINIRSIYNIWRFRSSSFFYLIVVFTFFFGDLASALTFEEVDTDADGVISLEEAMSAMPEMDEAAENAADHDGDGSISPEEFDNIPQDYGPDRSEICDRFPDEKDCKESEVN